MQKETEKFNNTDIMEGMSSISAVISAIKENKTDRKVELKKCTLEISKVFYPFIWPL